MPILKVQGRSGELQASVGQSLLDVIMDNAVPIATSCGGVAACGLCRLTVVEGMEHLATLHPREVEHLGNLLIERGMRLACQARFVVDGEVQVQIPAVEDGIRRKQEKYTRMLKQQREQRRQEQGRHAPKGPGRRRR